MPTELFVLLCTLKDNDGATAVPLSAHIYTPPMFDDGGCTRIVFSGGYCSATANLQDSSLAKQVLRENSV